ncbi:hypothetical protein [Lysinibacter sp. HNR]|uniref:hypothetical protein n=1 Tax=Lysinibacter sp. HNR TaxID=3031408 RepID=UPI002435030B|nr:hypothetical protein [Lysinibacter sp. HNR]WGD37554.1 hypothetical protein FrondiHNR_01120 [Lysinibacter sp. HNR]
MTRNYAPGSQLLVTFMAPLRTATLAVYLGVACSLCVTVILSVLLGLVGLLLSVPMVIGAGSGFIVVGRDKSRIILSLSTRTLITVPRSVLERLDGPFLTADAREHLAQAMRRKRFVRTSEKVS